MDSWDRTDHLWKYGILGWKWTVTISHVFHLRYAAVRADPILGLISWTGNSSPTLWCSLYPTGLKITTEASVESSQSLHWALSRLLSSGREERYGVRDAWLRARRLVVLGAIMKALMLFTRVLLLCPMLCSALPIALGVPRETSREVCPHPHLHLVVSLFFNSSGASRGIHCFELSRWC